MFIAGFFACDSEDASDCFQTEGNLIQSQVEIGDFSKIRTENDVTLILKQDAEYSVTIETGENLLNDVAVFLDGETLVIQDNNGCNVFRDYGVTTAIVSSPNITEIRNSSSREVRSEGILEYPELTLISNTTGNLENPQKNGDFILQLNCDNLRVQANGQSVFYLSGYSRRARLNFADEWPRFEGEDLMIDDLTIFQRSATVMIVNPQKEITGEIRATGDVISVNEPPIVEVEEFFTGRLIFQD